MSSYGLIGLRFIKRIGSYQIWCILNKDIRQNKLIQCIYIINLIRSYHSNLVAWHLDPIIGEFRHRWILHHKQAKKWKQYHIDDCSPHFQDFLLALYCYHLSPCFTFPYCTVYIRLICTCANITLYLIGKLLAACHAHRAKHGRCH